MPSRWTWRCSWRWTTLLSCWLSCWLTCCLVFPPTAAWTGPPSCYLPPVDVPVTVPFMAAACDYCAGHRGVEYDVATGTAVRAVAAGVVSFSGVVVGVRYVVVRHDDGLSATYGSLQTASRRAGDTIRAGDPVGTTTASLYFGLRNGDTYVDPARYLGRLHRSPRLIPTSSLGARPGRTPVLQCTSSR